MKEVMGPLRSKPIDECIKEVKTAVNQGNKHILLVAEDVGSYGLDTNSNLPELLKKITNISGDFTITFSGISPRWIVKYIDDLETIIKTKRIVFINISLQSGSSRILTLMHKFSEIEKVKDALLRIKKAFPEIYLEAQVLIGFPTETEKNFKGTLNLIKKIRFDSCHIFKYRNKRGIEARTLMPQVTCHERSKRFKCTKEFLIKEGYELILRNRRLLVAKRHNI
jgi:tRNA A37 methylthiotransferase MiaB